MTKIIAARPLRYGGKAVAAGEAFEARERDARLLVLLGRAREPTTDSDEPRRRYKRRDLRAES